MSRNKFEASTEAEIRSLVANALENLLSRTPIEEVMPADAPTQDDETEALSRAHIDWLNNRIAKGVN
jgi:hypothetical protein